MRVVFGKRDPDQVEFGLIYGGIALLALWVARSFPVLSFFPPCAFKAFFGVPCPSCGSTRSVVHLANGDLFAALAMNPLITLCFIAAIFFFLYSLITLSFDLPRIGLILSTREGTAVRAGLIGLVLAQWVYLAFITLAL
jgi:hypothetical protein